MGEKKYVPDWTDTPPVPGSYRSIVKEGRPDQIKVPSYRYYAQLKRDLKIDDQIFKDKQDGNQPLGCVPASTLDAHLLEELTDIVGKKNVQVDDYNRVKYRYGKLAEEIVSRKRGVLHEITGAVVVLDALEKNIRLGESLAVFEIGSVFEPVKNDLPNEWRKLGIAMTGLREATAWDIKASAKMDFYDLKGRLELVLSGLRFIGITYMEASASTMPSAPPSANYLHPGKAAEIKINGPVVGVFGELHPLVKEGYVLGDAPVLVAEFDLETLRRISPAYGIVPVSEFPPVYEDIAIIVND